MEETLRRMNSTDHSTWTHLWRVSCGFPFAIIACFLRQLPGSCAWLFSTDVTSIYFSSGGKTKKTCLQKEPYDHEVSRGKSQFNFPILLHWEMLAHISIYCCFCRSLSVTRLGFTNYGKLCSEPLFLRARLERWYSNECDCFCHLIPWLTPSKLGPDARSQISTGERTIKIKKKCERL